MNKKLVSTVKYSIFFFIGMLLIYLVFKDADLEKMYNDLKSADYKWMILSFVMGYAAYISRGLRWLQLLEPMGYKPKAINAINSVAITYFTNLALPRAGEVARATSLNQSEGIPVDKLLGTIVIERIIDMIFLLSLMVLTVIIRYEDLISFFESALSQDESSTSSDGSSFLIYFGATILVLLIIAFLLRNRIKETTIYDKIRAFLSGIKEGIITVKHMKNKGIFIAHSFFIWIMYYLMVYVIFFAMPETNNLTISDGIFIMAVGSLGMIAPVPGGMGAYHGAVMLGLFLLGIPKEIGLSFAVIVHTTQTLVAIISGPIAIFMTSIAKGKRLKLEK
ncbi:MAG: flippase-like domain-containing protein [Flavobacteriales bacterium]|nr:flippase-like domain-containing protein [Flavobacteriales bacterium]